MDLVNYSVYCLFYQDIGDRAIAVQRNHIREYLRSGHDVTNVFELREAMTWRGGNSRVFLEKYNFVKNVVE